MTVGRMALAPGDVARVAAELSPPPPDPAIGDRVAEILADVRARGDAALVAATRRFDAPEFDAGDIRVPVAELDAAARALPPALRDAVEVAAAQVRRLAESIAPADAAATLEFGQRIAVRQIPVAAAGLYVPGGRAPYPSTAIMAVVPAQVAGVGRLAIVTPPAGDRRPHAVTLGVAGILGVDEVYAVGGPAAIGALAFGTETIAPVDVIAGPGSAWVQEAKRQVVGRVGIDGIAGPSELIVIAGRGADPAELAADLLGQAEHGPDSPAIAVSDAPELLDAVAAELAAGAADGRVTLLDVPDLATAVAFAEAFAPEHLQLQVDGAGDLAATIRHAGAVFVGANGGTAFGDYVAGSNHILPTGGAARFASSVSAATFTRRMAVVDLPDAAVRALTPHLAAIADAEGFDNHRRSAEVRAARIERQGGPQ